MKIYLIAEPASKHALRITTAEVYDSIHNVFFACLSKCNLKNEGLITTIKFKEYIQLFVVCYWFELNKEKSCHRMGSKKLLQMFNEDESLKKEITKLELRDELK